jgi:hypothetical protein
VGPLVSPPTGTQECHCEIAGTHSDGNDLNLRLPISIIHRDRKSGVTTVPVHVSLPSNGRSFKALILVSTGIFMSNNQSLNLNGILPVQNEVHASPLETFC